MYGNIIDEHLSNANLKKNQFYDPVILPGALILHWKFLGYHIKVEMANKTFVLDEENNSVTSFQLLGPVREKLISPCCVSVSATGEYVVSDPESCFIVIYSSLGEYLSHFSTIPKSTFYLLLDLDKHKPHDVAWLSSKKIVYTQPWGSKVVVSNWKGKVSTCIQGKPLYEPFGVCVDNLDQIYITDRNKGRILCYSADGKLIKTFGGLGANGYNFMNPHYIVISGNGDIVLNDVCKDNLFIKIFSRKSGVHHTIPTDIENSKHSTPGCLALDHENNILQADNKNKLIHLFRWEENENNEFMNEKIKVNSISELYGITFNRDGNLACIDQDDKRIKILPLANLYCNGHIKSSSDMTEDSN